MSPRNCKFFFGNFFINHFVQHILIIFFSSLKSPQDPPHHLEACYVAKFNKMKLTQSPFLLNIECMLNNANNKILTKHQT